VNYHTTGIQCCIGVGVIVGIASGWMRAITVGVVVVVVVVVVGGMAVAKMV